MMPVSSFSGSSPESPGTENTVEPPEGDLTISKSWKLKGWCFRFSWMSSKALLLRARYWEVPGSRSDSDWTLVFMRVFKLVVSIFSTS